MYLDGAFPLLLKMTEGLKLKKDQLNSNGFKAIPKYFLHHIEWILNTEITDLHSNKIDHAHALADEDFLAIVVEGNLNFHLAKWGSVPERSGSIRLNIPSLCLGYELLSILS